MRSDVDMGTAEEVTVTIACEEENTGTDSYPNDIGLWPNEINDTFRDYWLTRGNKECRNNDSDFKTSAKTERDRRRHCTASLFTPKHSLTGEILDLSSWLCYSESTGKVYCFPCRLLSTTESYFNRGFDDWKHGHEKVEAHSKSPQHRKAISSVIIRSKIGCRVDKALMKEMETERKYWREVLTRVVDVRKLICERGSPVRGKYETLGSVHNGNYLGIMELLSKYDPFLARHLDKYGNKGSGSTSYLSHSICGELIIIMADKVMQAIVAEVQESKYFSTSVDSTPNITHTDQLSFTIRYVLPSGPVERFLAFVPIPSHTGEYIADTILNFFEEKCIDIQNCRGQSYDNASNMSGKYKGVQQRIKCVCSYAELCPCCAHSLNLVGVCAVESSPEAASLFSLIQKVYTFYSAPTKLWEKQFEAIKKSTTKDLVVVKKLSDTRWSARYDAVRALSLGYKEHIYLLTELSSSNEIRGEVRSEAVRLSNRLKELDNSILLQVWNVVLERVYKTSVQLQKEGLPINVAVNLLQSLLEFIES